MKYKLDFSPKLDFTMPSASGAMVGAPQPATFVAWQPSTWPGAPAAVDGKCIEKELAGRLGMHSRELCPNAPPRLRFPLQDSLVTDKVDLGDLPPGFQYSLLILFRVRVEDAGTASDKHP
jgi:hypothetical protein